jgi:thiol-disulfide isomerase/thioredoxin
MSQPLGIGGPAADGPVKNDSADVFIPVIRTPAVNATIYPEPNTTTEEPLAIGAAANGTQEEDAQAENGTPGEPAAVQPAGKTEVFYYFFWADYCSTCKTMMPWIRDLAKEHPTLKVQMIDLYSGSPLIARFQVSSTAVSVILKKVGGVDVSGTKAAGFMDKDGIERFMCTELDDEKCGRLR